MINANPHPILLRLGLINVYFYGIIVVFGILLCMYLIERLSRGSEIDKNHLENLYFYIIILE